MALYKLFLNAKYSDNEKSYSVHFSNLGYYNLELFMVLITK